MEINKVLNINCLDGFKDIPDESVDLVVSDPPYKITSRGSSGTMGGYWKSEIAKSGNIFTNNDIKPIEYLPELYRILKDKSIAYIMCNNKNLQEMLNVGTDCGFKFVKTIIWDKGNKICGKYYMGCYEYIILFRKGGDRPINNCSTPDILSIPIKKLKGDDGKNLHDTEKPVELMKILIENSSNEGDLVLDPFMGIGATAIASIKSNRNFIGFELEEKYWNIINNRIAQAEYQKTLD